MTDIHDLIKGLRQDVRNMQPGDPLYEMLHEELTARGLWVRKSKPRGKPFPKGDANPVRKRWDATKKDDK